MGNVQELRLASTVIDLIAMAAALWIGFYIVTRSPYSLLSWLGALILWVLSTFFLANALLYNEPSGFYLAWLQQLVILVMPLLLHLTYLLLPDPLAFQRVTRLSRFNRSAIPLAYIAAIGLILSGALPSTPPVGFFAAQARLPEEPGTIGFMSRTTTPLFPLFVVYLVLVSILSLINLWQAREQARRGTLSDPFTTFFVALALAAFGGLYGSIGTAMRAELPTFPVDILLGIGVILVGIAVARYSALLEGRSLERDFIYTLIVVGSLTAFYVLVVFGLYLAGQVSFVTLVLTIVGTIAANSLFDGLRLALDRLFYRRQFQTLRRNLRDLAREAGSAASIRERLQAILDSLCRVLRVKDGFIALAGPEGFAVRAAHGAFPDEHVFPAENLSSHETVGLVHPDKKGLPGMKILVPLSAEGNQVGAMVLGGKDSRQGFTDAELDLIEDLADQTAGLIYGLHKQEENARELNAMVESFREKERNLQLQMQKMIAASQAGPSEAPAAARVAVTEE
ncbi:MAG: GAF domain-containing protein, partial [Rudaea sp.]